MTSLYIHIPFCKKKCNYCDFVSYAGKEELINQYVEKLIEELKTCPQGSEIKTIYFGGGTPTLLQPQYFENIIRTLTPSIICLSPLSQRERGNIEISIEANPGTADKAKLKALRELEINRLSIGAQSFNDKHLKTLGRIHNSSDIFRIFEDARSVGFNNINLDLIFALPNQTLDEWKNDLQTAIELNPEHLSTYNLQIEEETYFFEVITKLQIPNYKQYQNSKFQLPNEETELAMYEYTIETLTTNGYKHYEISNFAKAGFECKHNINYWKNGNYMGVGAGAHSHLDGKRWANSDSIEKYIGCGCAARNVNRQMSDDSLFLGLRLLEGLPINAFKGFEKEVAELKSDGLLQEENGRYKLSRRGTYLGNLVFERFA